MSTVADMVLTTIHIRGATPVGEVGMPRTITVAASVAANNALSVISVSLKQGTTSEIAFELSETEACRLVGTLADFIGRSVEMRRR